MHEVHAAIADQKEGLGRLSLGTQAKRRQQVGRKRKSASRGGGVTPVGCSFGKTKHSSVFGEEHKRRTRAQRCCLCIKALRASFERCPERTRIDAPLQVVTWTTSGSPSWKSAECIDARMSSRSGSARASKHGMVRST